jgi:LPS-assembly lipoprotein
MRHRLIRFIGLITAIFFILSSAGCGFHLRGQHVLPPQLHYLQLLSGSPYGDFETTLRNSLTLIGVNVTRCNPAPVTLHIMSVALYNDVPTIGGSNQARIYVYYYAVTFEVYDDQHRQMIPPQTVTATRTIIVNAGTALESTGQLSISIHDMQVETSHMIINMLNAPAMFR